MSNIEELERLSALWRDGTLTEQEFNEQKAKLLSTQSKPPTQTFFSQNRMMIIGATAAVIAVLAGSYLVSRSGQVEVEHTPQIDAVKVSNETSPSSTGAASSATAQSEQTGAAFPNASIAPFSNATPTGTWLSLQTEIGGENSEIGRLYVRPQRDVALLMTRSECGSSCGDQYTHITFSIIFPVGSPLPRHDNPGEFIVDGRSFEATATKGYGTIFTWPEAEISFKEPYLSINDRSEWTSDQGTELERAMSSAKSMTVKLQGASYVFLVDQAPSAPLANDPQIN